MKKTFILMSALSLLLCGVLFATDTATINLQGKIGAEPELTFSTSSIDVGDVSPGDNYREGQFTITLNDPAITTDTPIKVTTTFSGTLNTSVGTEVDLFIPFPASNPTQYPLFDMFPKAGRASVTDTIIQSTATATYTCPYSMLLMPLSNGAISANINFTFTYQAS